MLLKNCLRYLITVKLLHRDQVDAIRCDFAKAFVQFLTKYYYLFSITQLYYGERLKLVGFRYYNQLK